MSFFEPPDSSELPDPEPDGPQYRMPPWLGAPSGVLPAIVSLEAVIAQTDEVAISISHAVVYPEAFYLELRVVAAGEIEEEPFDWQRSYHRHGGRREIPPDLLRFGLEFADGHRLTNFGSSAWARQGPNGPGEPSEPVMDEIGGGGGGDSWSQEYFIWPLPPPGPLQLVVEWPSKGIEVTRHSIDGSSIAESAARTQAVFPRDHLPLWPDDDEGTPEISVIR